MQKRRLYLLLIGLVVVVGLFLALAFPSREREPEYGGKRLSEWVMRLPWTPENEPSEAEDAIRSIGTNAIPYLLDWIRYYPSDWRRSLDDKFFQFTYLLGRARILQDQKEMRAIAAMWAFKVFSAEADQSMPALANLLNSSKAKKIQIRAAGALGFCGKNALPPLLAVLTNQDVGLRIAAAESIGLLRTNARPAIPAMQ